MLSPPSDNDSESDCDLNDKLQKSKLDKIEKGAEKLFYVYEELTHGYEVGQELIRLTEELGSLLELEAPKVMNLADIILRNLSKLLPLAQSQNNLQQSLSCVTTKLLTFGVDPSAMLFGLKTVTNVCNSKANKGRSVLISAIHNSGGPVSSALDFYYICEGIYSLYNTYAEATRLCASITFCLERINTIKDEILALSGLKETANEKWENLCKKLSEYWNQPSDFNFSYFITRLEGTVKTIVEPLKALFDVYEAMEPLRISSYLAIIMPANAKAESQLEQVTRLLTNACYNISTDTVLFLGREAGTVLGRSLPNIAIKAGVNVGVKAALGACVTTLTGGMSFPITVAVLANCITDPSNKKALLDYANNFIRIKSIAETKLDEHSESIVEGKTDESFSATNIVALIEKRTSFLANPAKNIAGKVKNLADNFNRIVSGASGKITGNIVKKLIAALIEDSDFVQLLKEELYSVIYQAVNRMLITASVHDNFRFGT